MTGEGRTLDDSDRDINEEAMRAAKATQKTKPTIRLSKAEQRIKESEEFARMMNGD